LAPVSQICSVSRIQLVSGGELQFNGLLARSRSV
jgi:hypothetical protein